MKTFLAAAFACVLASCAAPSTVTRTRDTRPAISIQGAPEGSTLFVDGLAVGPATAYPASPMVDGNPAVLRLEPGTHDVEVRDATGAIVYREKVFLESELKNIVVH